MEPDVLIAVLLVLCLILVVLVFVAGVTVGQSRVVYSAAVISQLV